MMEINYIAWAIPVFFILIGIELVTARIQGRRLYRLNDSINNLSCGVLQQVVTAFINLLLLAGYAVVYEAFHVWNIPTDQVWTWVVCFLSVDFCYYWFHRMSHQINFLWAAHVVHHQSEEYNLSVALRQSSLQPVFNSVFYLPLAFLGFHPLMTAVVRQFNTLYQFWIHTQTIDRMGFLETFLMTPSHHRVHHGRDPKYIDRNHGASLIIWDKAFGTFQKEEETPHFGLTKPLNSWNPIWANLHYWKELFENARMVTGFNKIKVFLKRPGWLPQEAGGFQAPQPVPDHYQKYNPGVSAGANLYVFLQFVFVVSVGSAFIFLYGSMDTPVRWCLAVFIGWSLFNLGALFEGRGFYWEMARLAAFPGVAFLALPQPFQFFVWFVIPLALGFGVWLGLGRKQFGVQQLGPA